MKAPLLSTKLYIPPIRQELVPRPHLVELLNQSFACKLTLVSAPAGFGKTTLVSEWVSQSSRPTAWVSLDENDNDLRRFLAYFNASLHSINIEVDEQLPEGLPTSQAPNMEDILIPVINQIADTSTDFALVLDDYHLIRKQVIHSALTFILENLPPIMHLVIASRADPPLPLTRLRARGELVEIRAAQLGFSLVDGDTFFNQIHDLNLPQEKIQAIIERTDGWVAALQMVSIASQGKSDIAGFIQGISGNQDYIADFLTTEVIQQQPEYIQDFLLKTSLLDQLSGPLCDALTNRDDSKKTLKILRNANLFLLPLDDHSDWFRYHHLFADLLRQRLSESQPDLIPSLYQKASEWFQAHHSSIEAIDYAIRGGHVERASAILEQEAATILMRSEIATFIRWVERLPDSAIAERPSLGIDYAWALLVSSAESETVETVLQMIETSSDQLKGRLNTVNSILAFRQRKVSEAAKLAKLAFEQISDDDFFYKDIAAWNLSALLFITGDTYGGIKMLEEAAKISLANKNLLVATVALNRLGTYHLQLGELDQAEAYFERALTVSPAQQTHPLPAACEAMLGLGKLAWERYELSIARQFFQDGLQLSKRWRAVTDIDTFTTLAHLQQSMGEVERSAHSIQTAQDIAKKTDTDSDDRFVASQAAHLSLRQGNLDAVQKWAEERDLESVRLATGFDDSQQVGFEVILRYELIVYARYLRVVNRFSEALSLLEKLLPSLKKIGHQIKVFETQIQQALILHAQGDTGSAVSLFGEVLKAAEVAGLKRIFIDEGPAMTPLIKAALDRGIESQFINQLLVSLQPNMRPHAGSSPVLIETLSERELEVLHFLVSELPVPDIAAELHVAVSTLRTHIKNIYSKLGVHSRFEAVSKSRELGLL